MKKLKVHYFLHLEEEGYGSCEDFLKSKNAQISSTAFFALPKKIELGLEALPKIDDVDLLIIMGSFMSANDEDIYSWLKTEILWLQNYINSGKPVIGLCLGAQIIAKALGAKVRKKSNKKVYWDKIYASSNIPNNCFDIPSSLIALELPSEIIDLPRNAIQLANNSICENKIYQYRHNILGFHFYLGIMPNTLDLFFEKINEELPFNCPSYVKSKKKILAIPQETYEEGKLIFNQAIDYVLNQTKKYSIY